MTATVEAISVGKTFPVDGTGVEALRDVNLKVAAGEFVVLTGPSGSGKSTLLHMLGAMDIPTQGEVRFEGRVVSRMTEGERTRLRCRGIGFVFQTFNLLPTLNALENVEIALRFAHVPRMSRKGRARELLEGMGLGKRLTPQSLSSFRRGAPARGYRARTGESPPPSAGGRAHGEPGLVHR